MLSQSLSWFKELRRPRAMRYSKMLAPFDGELLEWMMGHGLAYIGNMPANWEPKPVGWAARKFYWRHMWWRKYV